MNYSESLRELERYGYDKIPDGRVLEIFQKSMLELQKRRYSIMYDGNMMDLLPKIDVHARLIEFS